MQRKQRIIPFLSLVLACASPATGADPLDPPEPAPSEHVRPEPARAEKLAIAGSALDNGPPWFGARVQAELTERAPLQAWTFDLPRAATVTFATLGTSTGPDLDTVLYLYRSGARGWGSSLARNDDHAALVFSSFSRTLQAGRYRVVVRGKTPRSVGPFMLSAACAGSGCPSLEPSECVFGHALADVPHLLRVSAILTYTAVDQLPDQSARERLHASASHVPGAGFASAEQVFLRADGGLVRWMRIWDDAGARAFSAYEYRIDARSYGAIHDMDSGELVARVSDGLVSECRVAAGRCLLGSNYQELLQDTRFDTLSRSTLELSSALALSSLAQAQLLTSVRVAYPEVDGLSAALASVDGNRVQRLVLHELATGRRLVAYEFGAGDNSFGAVFFETDAAPIAHIDDGALSACCLLESSDAAD